MQVHLVAIEVGVEGRAHTLVEAEGAVRLDDGVEGHDAQLVQAGLAIEEDDVVVDEVALDHVAALQLLRDLRPVAELEELL